ncbi:diacylglycerol kinase [Thalassobacillus devorans]|uniref:Diacylglycerol kinase n=1 Tax=Thalassobacillus devorans TaxID=279813 RepID=A0ABQ1P842_9BACI|nr:diacylglycerol kinase family protein [Thalassobacillus devorans]NIK29689.1 diacylglycerol kinase [Thalassobacillus devorans]GGC92033.1 diacylglycerol kinase [Thalassobacillus devorans]
MSSGWNGNKKRGIGFKYAWRGILTVTKTERNMKYHLIIATIVLVCSMIMQISRVEWAIVLLVIGLVLTMEMINTSLEKAMDHLSPDIHPTVGMVKDIAAGAVLIAALLSVIIGLMIFIPKLVAFF